jgi:hypothetical protein
MQRGGRLGLSGMRAVDAVIIASARMRDVPTAARRRDPAAASHHAAMHRGNSGPLSLQSLQNCTPRSRAS